MGCFFNAQKERVIILHQPKAKGPIVSPPPLYSDHIRLDVDQTIAYRAKCLFVNLVREFDEDTATKLLTAAMPEIYKKAQSQRCLVPADYKPQSFGTKKRGDD